MVAQLDDTLVDLLAQKGISLKSYAANHSERLTCPRCEGGKTREKCLSVTVDADGRGAVFKCHRGTCEGYTGSVKVRSRVSQPEPHPSDPPLEAAPADHPAVQPDWFYEFWDERHIGAQTLTHFGVYATEQGFPEGENPDGSIRYVRKPCIVFPYRWNHKVVGRKFRSRDKKFSQSASSVPTLFNADSIAEGEPLIWCEGEADVCAMWEAGFRRVVSLRDGAPQKLGEGERRFAAIGTHAAELAKVPYHILAGDMDDPGMVWREELARRLGKHKVRLVTWPSECKDACDVLRTAANAALSQGSEPNAYEKNGIQRAIQNAAPYPMEGVRDLEEGVLERLLSVKPLPTMSTGASSTDAVIRLPTEGKLIVWTGIPAHGKTSYIRFLAVHTMRYHGRRWLVFTAEESTDDFILDCAQIFTGLPRAKIGPAERDEAEATLRKGLRLLEVDAERNPPTIDSLLERAVYSVLRDGTTDLLLDPWNEVEHARGDMTETDYVGRTLQRFRAFAHEYGCNVWIIAHPAKPPPLRAGEKRRAPTGYDLAGSAHFINKCDFGGTVWMPEVGKTQIRIWKSRRTRWASTGAVADLDYDQATGRYLDPIKQAADPEVAARWED